MKKLYLVVFLAIIVQNLSSQVWDKSYAIPKQIAEARNYTQAADSLYNAEKYAEAIPLYLKITALNTTDYESVFNLGECYGNTSDFVQAKRFYLLASDANDFEIVLEAFISIASIHANKNELDSSFFYLNMAIKAGLKNSYLRGLLDNESFNIIRNDERYFNLMKEIKGEGFTGFNQYSPSAEQIKQGVLLMYRKIKEQHPNPYRHFTAAQFDEKVNAVIRKAGKLSVEQYYIALNEIASMVGDVHTSVFPSSQSLLFKNSFGFRLWKFRDGLFVRATTPENRHLLDARIISINDIPADKVLELMMKKFPKENESMALYEATYYLHFPSLLYELGLSAQKNKTKISFQLKDKEIKDFELEGTDTTGFQYSANTCRNLSIPKNWVNSFKGQVKATWLKNSDKNYWYEITDNGNCIYFQLNSSRSDPKHPWGKFISEMFDIINKDAKIERLVFDQRNHEGGWHYMAQNLMHGILQSPKINQPGHLYIINSRITQSAGILFTTLLEKESYPIIIGEPAGAHPNIFNGRLGNHPPQSLPGTDIVFRVSTLEAHFSDDIDNRHIIAPDIPMEMTYEDFINDRDPLLEMAISFPVDRADIFFTDAGGRKIRVYYHWKRPSQANAFEKTGK